MKALLWRVIYAVIVVVILLALLPPLFALLGFPMGGALWQVLRICIAGIAVLYIIFGPGPPAPF